MAVDDGAWWLLYAMIAAGRVRYLVAAVDKTMRSMHQGVVLELHDVLDLGLDGLGWCDGADVVGERVPRRRMAGSFPKSVVLGPSRWRCCGYNGR